MRKQQEAREKVLDLIESLAVGEAIPSERRLSTDLGMARLTVRAALDQLVRDGHLVRRHGSGTFVTQPKIAQQLTLTSFSEDMRRRGMTPSSRTLELTVSPAGARLSGRLQVPPEDLVTRVRRLRYADGETMAIETLYVPRRLVPELTAADLENRSFYQLLEERYEIIIASGVQYIEPTVTDEEESTLLGVPVHSPAFLFERTTRDESGQVIELVRSIYRGDRYRLITELTPQRSRAGRSGAATGEHASTTPTEWAGDKKEDDPPHPDPPPPGGRELKETRA
jgi:GntR family transcriptional regulator